MERREKEDGGLTCAYLSCAAWKLEWDEEEVEEEDVSLEPSLISSCDSHIFLDVTNHFMALADLFLYISFLLFFLFPSSVSPPKK